MSYQTEVVVVLDLACDYCGVRYGGSGARIYDRRETFSAPTQSAAFAAARAAGWRTYPSQGKAKCPMCSGGLQKPGEAP